MTHNLKVITYNMANYDDHKHWDQRLQLMADIFVQEDADVILLQEVRFNPDEPSTKATYQNMAEQVLFELNQRQKYLKAQIVSLPIAYYPLNGRQVPFPKSLAPQLGPCEWEGLSVISKIPIFTTSSLYMTIPKTGDLNPRATQAATILLPTPDGLVSASFFNTHFAYLVPDAMTNVVETLKWMNKSVSGSTSGYWLLAGDLNVTPDQEPYKAILKTNIVEDMWTHLNPRDPGPTIPSGPNPNKRIDFILPSKAMIEKAKEIKIIGNVPNNGVYASDHYGLSATFEISILDEPDDDLTDFHMM